MNTKNNRKRRESQHKIEAAFIELLQKKEVNQISVIEICEKAHLNRTTFYSNYLDIYDLVDKIGAHLIDDLHDLYASEEEAHYNSHNFLKLFYHIKDNQLFYKTYFKLGLDIKFQPEAYDRKLAKELYNNKHIDYHIRYSQAGITAIIKHWLNNDCDISPEELFEILKDEYKNKGPVYSNNFLQTSPNN